MFGLGTSKPKGLTRVHFLDSLEFMNGKLYFEHPELIPLAYRGQFIIHAGDQERAEDNLKRKGLWFVNDKGDCPLEIHEDR